MIAAIAAVALVGPSYRERFPLPDNTFGSGWGVNVQFVRPEKPGEMQKIANAGFKWIRANLYWSEIEGARRGTYQYYRYDDLIRDCERTGIRPILIFSFENHLYDSVAPRTAEQRRAFAAFAVDAVKRYRGKGIVWEMWNEPNHPMFWKPGVNVDDYVLLAKEVGRAIRREAPEEWFIGPGVAGMDWAYLDKCFDGGLLGYFDAVSTHPYRQTNPEPVLADWSRLQAMIDLKRPLGKKVPIVNSEWGYSQTEPGITEERQAQYAVRMYMLNLMAGVNLSIHFGWKDIPTTPRPIERVFGTVKDDLAPKRAHQAIQRAVRELGGYKYQSRLATGGHIFALHFRKGDQHKVAAWSTTPRGTLRLGSKSFDLTEMPEAFAVSAADLGLAPSHSYRSRTRRNHVVRRP